MNMKPAIITAILGLLFFGCCGSMPDSLASPVVSDECVSVASLNADFYNLSEAEENCYIEKYLLPAQLGTKDYEDCDAIVVPPMMAACYGGYASFLNDSSKCSTLLPAAKEACIYTFAIYTNDASVCGRLSNSVIKEDCMISIMGLPPSQLDGPLVSDLCISIPASMAQDYSPTDAEIDCYTELYFAPAFLGEKDYGDCDEIVGGLYKGACYGSYGAFLGDNSKCDLFTGWDNDMCLYYFAWGTGNPVACNAIDSDFLREMCISEV
jgi:hypothetical protein